VNKVVCVCVCEGEGKEEDGGGKGRGKEGEGSDELPKPPDQTPPMVGGIYYILQISSNSVLYSYGDVSRDIGTTGW